MADNYEDGVWRTISGRRVFIRKGEDLASAMKRSGKFDTFKRKGYTNKEYQEQENRIAQLTKERNALLNEEIEWQKDWDMTEDPSPELEMTAWDREQKEEELREAREKYSEMSKNPYIERKIKIGKENYEKIIKSKNHTTDDEFESISKQLKEISKRTGGTDLFSEAGKKWKVMNPLSKETKSIQQQYGLKDKRNEMITKQFLENKVDDDEFRDYMTRGNESKETIKNITNIRNKNVWKNKDATEIYNSLTQNQRNKLSQATKDLEMLTKGTPGYENAKEYVEKMENKAVERYLKKHKNDDISPMSEYSDTTGTGLSDKQHSSLSNMSFSEMQNLARDYNIDTKGLSKKQLMAKIIAIFNK